MKLTPEEAKIIGIKRAVRDGGYWTLERHNPLRNGYPCPWYNEDHTQNPINTNCTMCNSSATCSRTGDVRDGSCTLRPVNHIGCANIEVTNWGDIPVTCDGLALDKIFLSKEEAQDAIPKT